MEVPLPQVIAKQS